MLCCNCLSLGLELFGDVNKMVDWHARAAGVYFQNKSGSCRMDFKNKRKLRQGKRKKSLKKARKMMVTDPIKHI